MAATHPTSGHQVPDPPSPSALVGVPWLRLTSLVIVAGIAIWFTQGLVHRVETTRFDSEVQQVEYAIGERMAAYVQVLRGGLGLFVASEEVTRQDWIDYVAALDVPRQFPGIRQMSFVPAVSDDDLAAFVEEVRMALPDFATRPPPPPIELVDTDLHGIVLFVAPPTAQNLESIGLDMMRDTRRREAMLAAVELGDAVLSPTISLLRGSGTEVGFIAYLPVVSAGEWRGWLSAVFYAEAFMDGLLGEDRDRLDLELHDGVSGPAGLLWSTAGVGTDGAPMPLVPSGDRLSVTRRVAVPGGSWEVTYRAGPELVSDVTRLAPWLVALVGVLAVLLLYASDRARRGWAHQVMLLSEAHLAVRHEATHDALTGLANRVLFIDRLETALERGARRDTPFALAYLDIDDFKPVNDTHGHGVGDALLQAIASRLGEGLRGEDTLARLGGDEFALILEQSLAPLAAVVRLCDDVVARIREPFDLDVPDGPVQVQVGASMGIAVYPDHGRSVRELVTAADTAMYAAKRAGKNRCRTAEVPPSLS